MKNMFNILVIVLSLVISFAIFELVFGNPENFNDPESKKEPKSGEILAMFYTGGPIVALLLSFVIIAITFSFERYFSIKKASGKGDTAVFIRRLNDYILKGAYDDALKECENQRGSLANILRAGIERFQEVRDDS